MLLGSRYGFALFSRKPIKNHLSRAPLIVCANTPVHDVLDAAFSRADERFYDDAILVDEEGVFIGLIYVHSLVRLQTRFLRENIEALEERERAIRSANTRLENDLAMAREVQLAMLPSESMSFPMGAAPGDERLQYAQLYRPAQSVGGDFVHVTTPTPSSLAVFISDVMGHGVRSALVAAMLRALIEQAGEAATDPGRLMTQVSRGLSAMLRPTQEFMFATAFYLVADSAAGTLSFSRAGHPSPVCLNRRKRQACELPCPRSGPGLCIAPGIEYVTAQKDLASDDALLLYTDGVIEVSDASGELFGRERLEECVRLNAEKGVASLVGAVFAEADRFAKGEFEDDVCLVGVDWGRAGEV
jgi:serine phosphatase RsbU (regulator of sigma subunit)